MPRTPPQLHRSAAAPDARVVNNLLGAFPTEDWLAYYWDVTPSGGLIDRRVIVQLPKDSGTHSTPVQIGDAGVIKKVRRWGVTISSALFSAVSFDPTAYLTHDAARFPSGDDQEIVDIVIRAAVFEHVTSLCLDAVFNVLAEQLKLDMAAYKQRHANLE